MLTGATIEGISAGKKWRVKLTNGTFFFIELQKDLDGNDIYVVKGENRVYELEGELLA